MQSYNGHPRHGQLTPIKQGSCRPVSHEDIAGLRFQLNEVTFSFKLTDVRVLFFFNWIAGSSQVNLVIRSSTFRLG